MRTRAVIGANFGDEGKGIVTDYLAAQGGDVVVRFNGGCQAGHTVMVDKRRHVFSHFGSGSFVGLPTFFARHTVINPVLFIKEMNELEPEVMPVVFIDPDAIVTTPWDMNANQDDERDRGITNHGSCGVGIFQTIKRNNFAPLCMRDLWGRDLIGQVGAIMNYYGKGHDNPERFIADCEKVADETIPGHIGSFRDPIFEGAQGLLLDQGNLAMYPHLTPSRCGMHNVRELMHASSGMFKPEECETYYVSRTYLTRHGSGPLPNHDRHLSYDDDTNVHNEWQGNLRFGHLDANALLRRVHADCDKPKLVFTHCDQASAPSIGVLHTFGPKRSDVSHSKSQQRRMNCQLGDRGKI